MKKYFLSIILLFVVFFLLAFGVQHSALAAQPVQENQACTPGKTTCASGLSCRQLNPQTCSNNNPQDCVTKCLKPVPKQKGQVCTGTGTQNNCVLGLVCLTDQSTCKQVTGPGHITGETCQTTCQAPTPTTPPPPPSGMPCKSDGDCGLGLVCNNDVCSPPNGVHANCTPFNGGNTSTQGSCAKGLTCVGFNSQECAHAGIGCTGICTAPPQTEHTSLPPSPPCTNWSKGNCGSVPTVLGSFPTSPEGFITRIFATLLSVSGAIALLLIIRAGYQLLVSQGNPQQIQEGRDQLIAVIVGLLFLIFAFVFLQIIGFDILRLPGFGQ